MNWELPDVPGGFRKGRGNRDKIANSHWIIEKAKECQKNIYFCFIDYAEAFDSVDHNKLWKSLKKWEYQTTLLVSWDTCIWFKKQHLELVMEQLTGSRLGKEYNKTVYCPPVYLMYTQSTSCEMPGWMNHKLESDCWEKCQQHQICRWYHTSGRKWRGTKEPLDAGERGEWKSRLKTQHSKD